MKVLHVITSLTEGGAQSVLYRLVRAKTTLMYEVVSMMDGGIYGPRLTELGVSVHTLDMPRGRITAKGMWALYGLILSTKCDVVQSWMYHADFAVSLIPLSRRRIKRVWGVHNANLDRDKSSFFTRLVVRCCAVISSRVPDRIVCCARSAMHFHAKWGYSRNKMMIVQNGLDLIEFKPDSDSRERIRALSGVRPTDLLIGMVARWNPHKDHANLIRALASIRDASGGSWRCVLTGAGMTAENSELLKLLNSHYIADRVILLGSRNDMSSVMNALDLHVLSSSGEAFPNVLVEALACGIPVVATNVGAGKSIVGDTGWIVPPCDSTALSCAIRSALREMEHPEVWLTRKMKCRNRAVNNFGVDRMVDAYKNVWREVLGK